MWWRRTQAGLARRPGGPCIGALQCRSAANKSEPGQGRRGYNCTALQGSTAGTGGMDGLRDEGTHRAPGTIDTCIENPPCSIPRCFQNAQPHPSFRQVIALGHPISHRSLASLAWQGCFGSLPPAVLKVPSTRLAVTSGSAAGRGGERGGQGWRPAQEHKQTCLRPGFPGPWPGILDGRSAR